MISRRAFLASTVAFAATAELPFAACGAKAGGRRLRLGVIADLHVKDEGSTDTFEKALRFFDAQKADGVVCAGDLATSGITSQLERVARTWFRVFPENRRSDGQPIEKLFIYGDHDMGGYAWKESRGTLSDEELHAQTIPTHDPAAIWERYFKEKWSPVQVKTVGGYAFFLGHHPPHSEETAFGNYNAAVEPTLAAHAAKLKGRPFFYVQHRPIPGLAEEDSVWLAGDPRIGATLRAYPNCIALTGHTHRSCLDEKMIWQGEFTAINVPSLRYLSLPPGRENSQPTRKGDAERMMMERLMPRDGQQGYLMDVTEREIAVRRLDFSYSCGAAIADPWRIPLPVPGKKPFAFATRAAIEVAPQFQPGAHMRIRVREDANRAKVKVPSVVVAFPPALSTPKTPRAFDYEIVADGTKGSVVRRVFSRKCYLPEELDAGNVECVFSREDLGEGPVTFTVRPCGAFSARGNPLVGHLRDGRAELAGAWIGLAKTANGWRFRSPDGTLWKACGIEKVRAEGNEGMSRQDWARQAAKRLKEWGFNTIGSGSDWMVSENGNFATTEMIALSMWMKDRGDAYRLTLKNEGFCDELANVFHPDFPDVCTQAARACCLKHRDERNFIGYFLDNELDWWGDGDWRACGLLDYALRVLPTGHAARRAAEAFKAKYPGDLEKARVKFTEEVAERYFSTIVRAIRALDPHHLVLGVRFAGIYGAPDPVWRIAGKWCDVVTLNCYPRVDLERQELWLPVQNASDRTRFDRRPLAEMLEERHRLTGRPLMISEWSFLGLDVPRPRRVGVAQEFASQRERAAAVEVFNRQVVALPYVIGDAFYRWSDEAAVTDGRTEVMNWGLVDLRNRSHEAVVKSMALRLRP